MRQLPERCESCKRQIATLETCALSDGNRKRDTKVTSREITEDGIRCVGCAGMYEDHGLIFAYENGTPLSPKNLVDRSSKPLLKKPACRVFGSKICGTSAPCCP